MEQQHTPGPLAIDTDDIRLDNLLKWAGITTTGGETRILIDERRIKRNGELETARRRKLVPGDIIEIEGIGTYQVTKE
ncbi:RNA-binding S4 domain-containing protein [Selenomonas sp.]|uniref:RNA-binding S4 domain-containing protein n=1 Tax=Selenomonas sp. TaxID=2053611 RepID=UPI002A748672|nr:RNA-binding S4 domain-containing protein [Selenomonas sp.]MDY3297738.1 RNA-binding S4 domain-containing protein [Selenomonas sp.]